MFWDTFTDRAALYGVFTRLFQGAAGFITAILILRFFSSEVQGYYYTFSNLLALQVFLELGLSAVITTFAAHEWAKLSLDGKGNVTGDQRALDRLRSLTRKIGRWYAIAGIILLVVLIPVGIWFFEGEGEAGAADWWYPWVAACLFGSLAFVMTPAWALLSGCGQIRALNAYRMIETVFRNVILWASIAAGALLWSAVGALAFSAIVGYLFLFARYRRFFGSLLEKTRDGEFKWMAELAPLQLRIGASWISGYFAFSLFTPAMFHFLGAADAGRMGITWAFVSGLSGIAATWLQVQSPAFSGMVARKEFKMLDAAIKRTAWIGVMVFVIGGCVGLATLILLEAHWPELASRFVPLGPILVFLIAECLHQVSMAQSTYLRGFKREPFFVVSIVSGIIIGGGTLWLTAELGAYGPALSYLVGMTIAFVWGTLIFVRCRRQWTSPVPG